MTIRLILVCVVICIIVVDSSAFSATSRRRTFTPTPIIGKHPSSSACSRPGGTTTTSAVGATASTSSSSSSSDAIVDEGDVTCYVTNDEGIATDGERPHVVCTSEPEEYAWFNGVDPKAMRKTDGIMEGAEQCVEVESHKGRPEWECE